MPLQGVCASTACAEADAEDYDIGVPASPASKATTAGKAKAGPTNTATAATSVPVMVVSKRKLKANCGPDARACFTSCEQHMKNQLKAGLMGMYAVMDKDDEDYMHDVMIFKDAAALNQWADNMVAWPATRAGRPIQEWVIQYDTKGSPNDWWEGVVIGGHTADTKDRLTKMGANLKYLKPCTQGYIKPKLKKVKGQPVVVYNKRVLKASLMHVC